MFLLYYIWLSISTYISSNIILLTTNLAVQSFQRDDIKTTPCIGLLFPVICCIYIIFLPNCSVNVFLFIISMPINKNNIRRREIKARKVIWNVFLMNNFVDMSGSLCCGGNGWIYTAAISLATHLLQWQSVTCFCVREQFLCFICFISRKHTTLRRTNVNNI